MKATAQLMCGAQSVDKDRGWGALLFELFKARLTFLVLLTAAVGFYVGCQGAVDYGLLVHTLLATGLVASGAAALNQYLERDLDAKMARTENRPIPSGRLAADTALIIGGLSAGGGMIYLALAVNPLTSVLGALTLGSYLFVYTPLKRLTPLNTVIGAVPGAVPPLMGWTAARGELTLEGWSLFGLLFFWQLPHFLAIAWLYRDDYARAGFAMLPVVDPEGLRTGRQAVSHALGLLTMSLFPALLGLAGRVYLASALVSGTLFLACAIQFSRRLTDESARRLFLASILYLPLLLTVMVFDKVRLS